jgi:type I restriction enzyme S subunit
MVPAYFMWAMNSPGTYRQAVTDVGGSTSPHVNITSIRKFALPLAPRDEQKVLAEQLEAAWTRSDALEAVAQRLASTFVDLDRAILAKAFRGELVPQDPNDEPASALLERLRAERAQNGKTTPAGRAGPRAAQKSAKKEPPKGQGNLLGEEHE